jgi:ppGpp synthetase/RelA/SpoT-type nucleotidyltranferase
VTDEPTITDAQWVEKHVTLFAAPELQSRYASFAKTLTTVLNKASKKAAPLAIVQARVKAADSFAEKILRKRHLYTKPVDDMTDLCGARVITHTVDHVRAVSDFIEAHLDVDWDNSDDASGRLQTTEFGYRSVHYIVSFKEGVFPTADVAVEVPPEVYGLKAEIQVRTILEHAWADISHDLTYKSPFKVPAPFLRRVAGLAARLEGVSGEISRIFDDLKVYGANYGAYMEPDQARAELDTLALLLDLGGKQDVKLAAKIGRLANTIGDWPRAATTLDGFADSRNKMARRELGKALCRLHEKESTEWLAGQDHLAYAASRPQPDLEAILALAQTWQDIDGDGEAAKLYRQAFEQDPSDPDCLARYLEFEMADRNTAEPARLAGPVIRAACDRCHKQIEAEVNLFGAYRNLALFHLWLEEPMVGLKMLARAIAICRTEHELQAVHRTFRRLSRVRPGFGGYDWLYRLLLLGLAVRYEDARARRLLEKLVTQDSRKLEGPVAILAGGCAADVEARIGGYHGIVTAAFQDFHGTLISGGTTAGVSRLAGDLGEMSAGIHTVGYLPETLSSVNVETDKDTRRYQQLRVTEGDDFSPLQPLQNWIDLLGSGIDPADVKLIGINGGEIAAAEYRIGLALGAKVAIVGDSGREAARILDDEVWVGQPNLLAVPPDSATLRVFLGSRVNWPLGDEAREDLARTVHENYCAEKVKVYARTRPNTRPWDDLNETFKRANFDQVDHIVTKLRTIGCDVAPAAPGAPEFRFTQEELDTLAELEHGRWNVDRFLDGWRFGETKDDERKLTPYLVPWHLLDPAIKKYDYDPILEIPALLARVKLRIVRPDET